MSEAYGKLWNPKVQARIDRDIEQNRKADEAFKLDGPASGAEVNVEQLDHAFLFGANIFNFDKIVEMERAFEKRVREICGYYKDRIPSWDIVNESVDPVPGKPRYGVIPEDYAFKMFKLAEHEFTPSVRLNINDEWKTRTTVKAGANGHGGVQGRPREIPPVVDGCAGYCGDARGRAVDDTTTKRTKGNRSSQSQETKDWTKP